VAGVGGSRSDVVKKKKERKKQTSCSIGHVHLCLTVGWVPVNLAEVVVVAETVAGVGGNGSGSRSDWRVLVSGGGGSGSRNGGRHR
jgi:hypothetical protein